jgi:nitronate monooxygenase
MKPKWADNALTERLGLDWPILQAPMGSLSTPALAAAVSNAGGLGGLGMWGFSAADARRRIEGFRQQSGGSLNVNYPLWQKPEVSPESSETMRARLRSLYDERQLGDVPPASGTAGEVSPEHLAMLLETRPKVISFHFGLPPREVIDAVKAAGLFVICSATSVAEARALEQSGVDAIVAQGTEAGGHRATFSGLALSMQAGLLSLLPQVVDAVSVPVIAAGGIADARTAAAAVMLGASGVQIGTAFLRCREANVLDCHREALATTSESSTIVTDLITGREARYIRNRLIDELVQSGLQALPMPAQLSLTAPLLASGSRDMAALFSGQSAGLARDTTAAEFVHQLGVETTRRLMAFAG